MRTFGKYRGSNQRRGTSSCGTLTLAAPGFSPPWRAEHTDSRRAAEKLRGFTLVELLIVLAIIAILSAVAYPSYARYMQRSEATDATGQLSQYGLAQEQTFQDNGNYGIGACSVAPPAVTQYFTFACTPTGNPATGFTATATGIGSMAGFSYQLDDSGNRTTLAYPGRTALPASCWLIKPGDC